MIDGFRKKYLLKRAVMDVILAVTGASGSLYGLRTLKALLALPVKVHLIFSRAGRLVRDHELENGAAAFKADGPMIHERHPDAGVTEYGEDELFAPPASGSFRHKGMLIAPCSMKTLAAVAGGLAETLIHRAADVCLKERVPLVLLTRETPLSLIHLENMTRVARAGGVIMPPCPAFYTRPATMNELVDATVMRALDQLGIHTDPVPRWGGKKRAASCL